MGSYYSETCLKAHLAGLGQTCHIGQVATLDRFRENQSEQKRKNAGLGKTCDVGQDGNQYTGAT